MKPYTLLLLFTSLCFIYMQTDGSHETYTGPLKAIPMRAFLDGYALKEPLPERVATCLQTFSCILLAMQSYFCPTHHKTLCFAAAFHIPMFHIYAD
jgi:hypothetical protein